MYNYNNMYPDIDDPNFNKKIPAMIHIWSWPGQKVLRTIEVPAEDKFSTITSLLFGKKSASLIVGFKKGSIGVILSLLKGDIAYLDCDQILPNISSLCFHHDYKTFVSSSGTYSPRAGNICIWNQSTVHNIDT
jgi:hypothetical protein